MDDSSGWSRLYALGVQAIIAAQEDAAEASWDYLIGTLSDNRVAANDLVVNAPIGRLRSGQSASRFVSAARDATGARMRQGATFAQALDATRHVMSSVAASEPHRIGRQASFEAGAADPRFSRWQRIAEPGACAWCRAAATRGAVYHSRDTAVAATMHRPIKGHTHCRCNVVELVDARAIQQSKDQGAKDWEHMVETGQAPKVRAKGGGQSTAPARGYDRVASVNQQLKVLRRQIDDGTATQWTRDRIAVLEAEAALT